MAILRSLFLLVCVLLSGSLSARGAPTNGSSPAPGPLFVSNKDEHPATSPGLFYFCSYNSKHAELVSSLTAGNWAGWIARLSGMEEVTVDGKTIFIDTRYSYAMFDGRSQAYQYVKETVLGWYPGGQVVDDVYQYWGYNWKNLELTIPGSSRPDQIVLLTAHLDSVPYSGPAPGADDNASGSAALLEIARLLQGQSFARTIRLVWFTGEEQGLRGSGAYTADHDLSRVVGVINLDMYAYDSNNDRCFEIHAGSLPQSNRVGQCIASVIDQYNLELTYDYLTQGATTRSDHASFWTSPQKVGAVLVHQNSFTNNDPNGCVGVDGNPYYHKATDTLDKLNLETSESITRAVFATALAMADQVIESNRYLPYLLQIP